MTYRQLVALSTVVDVVGLLMCAGLGAGWGVAFGAALGFANILAAYDAASAEP